MPDKSTKESLPEQSDKSTPSPVIIRAYTAEQMIVVKRAVYTYILDKKIDLPDNSLNFFFTDAVIDPDGKILTVNVKHQSALTILELRSEKKALGVFESLSCLSPNGGIDTLSGNVKWFVKSSPYAPVIDKYAKFYGASHTVGVIKSLAKNLPSNVFTSSTWFERMMTIASLTPVTLDTVISLTTPMSMLKRQVPLSYLTLMIACNH
jgi:hypothetical protein